MELSILPSRPQTLTLLGARMTMTVTDDGLVSGVIGGAITSSEIDDVIRPVFFAWLTDMIAEDCQGTPPTCCTENTAGEARLETYDHDDDCLVSWDEYRASLTCWGPICLSALQPDLDLLERDSVFNPRYDGIRDVLSVGIGFTAVEATFNPPE